MGVVFGHGDKSSLGTVDLVGHSNRALADEDGVEREHAGVEGAMLYGDPSTGRTLPRCNGSDKGGKDG